MQPKDYQARLNAALPDDKNIIVEAGAGTGKTTLLIDRLCYLILGKDIPIDKIVALTFTDKAAAEIKIRLLLKMQKILAELETPTTEDETTLNLLNAFGKNKEDLLKAIQASFELAERAMVSTIHSFCLQILRRFPLEAGLAPKCEVDDGTAADNIFDKEWSAFLERELTFNSTNARMWEELLTHIKLEDIKDFTKTLLKPSIKNYHPLKYATRLKEICLARCARATELALQPMGRNRSMAPALAAAVDILKESAAFFTDAKHDKSRFNIEKLPTQPAEWELESYTEAIDIIRFAQAVNIDNQILITKAFNLAAPFAAEFKEKLGRENIISYDGLIQRTKDLLKGNAAVRRELKQEYKSILIDEFQDTDPAQGEILLFLAEDETSHAKTWQEVTLAQGKLFVVGDPKQSIYRFRGADITAYEKFTDLMMRQGAQKCFLQTNFRSSKNIIAFANAFGNKSITEQKGIQPKYIEINNGKDFPAPKVQIAAVEADTGKIDDLRHNQAQFIAQWIKDNAFKTKLSNGKVMTYKDIAILLRTTTKMDIYTEALKRFDIKYTVEETRNFYTAQEVMDIINILKVINDPKDKTALLGVLRSPLCLCEDRDILELSKRKALNIFAENTEGIKGIGEAYKMLKNLHYKAGRIALSELINEIVWNTGFTEFETLSSQKEQTIANIFKFVAIVRQLHGYGALSLGQFLYYAQKYAEEQNKEGESPLAEESLDTVTLMTMHKAKGLEFPAVIITDISKKEKVTKAKRPEFIEDWSSGAQGLRLGAVTDGAFALLEESARKHSAAEELRILYVALTRAKEHLLLAGDLKVEETTISAALQNAGCYPNTGLKPCTILSGDAEAEVKYLQYCEPELFTDKHYYNEAEENTRLNIPAWLEAWHTREQEYKAALKEAKPITPSQQNYEQAEHAENQKDSAAITGTLCHKMITDIFTCSAKTPSEQASIMGIDPDIYAVELNEAIKITADFEKSPAMAELKKMQFMAAELPFTIQKNGQVISGIMDAVFRTEEGKICIIDYKSDNIDISAAPQRALLYKPQLDFYEQAAEQIFKTGQIRTAVIFLRVAQIIYIQEIKNV